MNINYEDQIAARLRDLQAQLIEDIREESAQILMDPSGDFDRQFEDRLDARMGDLWAWCQALRRRVAASKGVYG